MIPEFPLPDEADLLLSVPAPKIFGSYSSNLLPESLRNGETTVFSVQNPIDLIGPLKQARISCMTKKSWTPAEKTSDLKKNLSTLSNMAKQFSATVVSLTNRQLA